MTTLCSDHLGGCRKNGVVLPGVLVQGEWWRLLTAPFLHGGLLHLFLNMLAIHWLGPPLEFVSQQHVHTVLPIPVTTLCDASSWLISLLISRHMGAVERLTLVQITT